MRVDLHRLGVLAVGALCVLVGWLAHVPELQACGVGLVGLAAPWPGEVQRSRRQREALEDVAAQLGAEERRRLPRRTRESLDAIRKDMDR
jgi:hypothetical protein